MDSNRKAAFVMTCPECSRKFVVKAIEFKKKSEVCCPYCGICYKTGSNVVEEIQKAMESDKYHY